jgi:hypothetical protein
MLGVLAIIALFSLFLAASSAASAATTHVYTGVSFGPDGIGGGEGFEYVQSIALDPASGDVYVLDGGAGKIYKFDAEGEPVDFSSTLTNAIEGVGGAGGQEALFQIALAPAGAPGGTAGDIYVANSNEQGIVKVYAASGALLGEPNLGEVGSGEVGGVAVSHSGHLFVGVFGRTILEYTPSGNPPTTSDLTAASGELLNGEGNGLGLGNVAVDGTGHVFAANYTGQGIYELQDLADTTPALIDSSARTLGIDPTTDEIYADRESEIVQYSSSGDQLGLFGIGEISASHGVAPLPDGTKVYVGTPTTVKIFGPAVPTPGVVTGAATEIGEHSATLNGTIDPIGGPAATCQFEYVNEEGLAAFAPCEPGGPFTGSSDQAVTARLSELKTAAEYTFRLIATNSNGSSDGSVQSFSALPAPFPPEPVFGPCPNEAFRVGAGAYLPDCRAYEQATPTDKNGISVQGLADWLVGSSEPSTPRVAYIQTTGTGIPAGEGGRQDFTPMLSTLDTGSWATQRMFPAESPQARFATFRGVSENLGYALIEVNDNPNKNAPGILGLDLVANATGSVTQIAVTQTEAQSAFSDDAIGNDGSYVFFESNVPVAPGAPAGVNTLYRWDRDTNAVSVVGLVPTKTGEEVAPAGSFGGAYAWSVESSGLGGQTQYGGSRNGQYVEAIHAVPPGGNEIYFTAASTGQLYLRRGLNTLTPTTVTVSEPKVVDHYDEEVFFGEPLPAAFQEASSNGSRAFFLSSQKLTSDATTGAFDEGVDLYRFDAATGALIDVTGGLASAENPNGARVLGLLGTSSDGDSGYFAARGNLAPGASLGERNIYRFEEASTGSFQIAFVVTLSPDASDASNWGISTYESNGAGGAGVESGTTLLSRSSRVSRDGDELLFTSRAPLTGYNNRGCGATASPTSPCPEIYMYSVSDGEVICISCDPTEAAAQGPAALTANYLGVSTVQQPVGLAPEAHLTRNLSSDGDRVFFQTPDSLVSRDEDGSSCRYLKHSAVGERALSTCLDVYEWEAPDTPGGSCTKVEVNGGCLYLLSAGDSADPSDFVDASADGSNVFIATNSPLVPSDRDELTDLYDVHVGGGLAAQFAQPATQCEGEACRSSATQPGSLAPPGSFLFAGPGNEKPKTCQKSKKNCQKQHKKKHGKKKKNDKKYGHSGSGKGSRK